MTDVQLASAPPAAPPALPPRPGQQPAAPPAPNSVSADPSVDPYEADRRASRSAYVWYRFFNPWVRFLLIFPILYVYAISSGALTYRNNDFQDQMQRLVNTQPNYNDSTATIPGDPSSTRPIRESGYYNYPYLNGRAYVPFILRDLFFDFLPALQGSDQDVPTGFANATPIIWNIVMLLMLFIRMDVIRWSEYLSIQMVLFGVNALVHVATTYPDSDGYQASCINPAYHVPGSWMFGTLTTEYCGDMMWSGHTQNTLLPMIIIRRLMWDFLGWNLSLGGTQPVQRAELLQQHPWIFSGIHNDYERNQLFMQYVHNHQSKQQLQQANSAQSSAEQKAMESTDGAKTLENYAPQYQATQQLPAAPSAVAAEQQRTALADELALQPHEKYDVHINVAAATAVGPQQRVNVDHDIFFRVYKSPYQTPAVVERFRVPFFLLATFVRLLLLAWFPLLLVSLILIRYHYSADIIVAVFVTSLTATNTHLLQWWVRMIYRPYYHNYLYSSPFLPVYLSWPLNAEQVNYEERIRRIGIGGML